MPFGQPLQHCSPVNALLTYEHLPVRVKLEVAARDLGGGSTNFQTRLKFMNWGLLYKKLRLKQTYVYVTGNVPTC